jgi:prepilin-type processing-associated H-X9-DG protein
MAVAEQQCQTCPYVKNAQVFSCPTRQNPCSYGYAYPTMWGAYPPIPGSAFGFPTGPALAEFTVPADTVMITDSGIFPGNAACNAQNLTHIYSLCGPKTGYSYPYVYEPLTNPWSTPLPLHQGMVTTAFVDGHVKAMKVEAMIRPARMFVRNR